MCHSRPTNSYPTLHLDSGMNFFGIPHYSLLIQNTASLHLMLPQNPLLVSQAMLFKLKSHIFENSYPNPHPILCLRSFLVLNKTHSSSCSASSMVTEPKPTLNIDLYVISCILCSTHQSIGAL